MIPDIKHIINELEDIAASAELTKNRAISMLKELERIHAPAPRKGKLTPAEIAGIRAAREKVYLRRNLKSNNL